MAVTLVRNRWRVSLRGDEEAGGWSLPRKRDSRDPQAWSSQDRRVFFLDEPGVLRTSREPVFIVGHIHSREPSALTRRIQTIRDRYKWYDEMKWNLITGGNRNLEAYGKVLDAFFDCTLDEARFA